MINRPEGVGQNYELQRTLAAEAALSDPEVMLESSATASSIDLSAERAGAAINSIIGAQAVSNTAEVPDLSELSLTEAAAAYQLALKRRAAVKDVSRFVVISQEYPDGEFLTDLLERPTVNRELEE